MAYGITLSKTEAAIQKGECHSGWITATKMPFVTNEDQRVQVFHPEGMQNITASQEYLQREGLQHPIVVVRTQDRFGNTISFISAYFSAYSSKETRMKAIKLVHEIASKEKNPVFVGDLNTYGISTPNPLQKTLIPFIHLEWRFKLSFGFQILIPEIRKKLLPFLRGNKLVGNELNLIETRKVVAFLENHGWTGMSTTQSFFKEAPGEALIPFILDQIAVQPYNYKNNNPTTRRNLQLLNTQLVPGPHGTKDHPALLSVLRTTPSKPHIAPQSAPNNP